MIPSTSQAQTSRGGATAGISDQTRFTYLVDIITFLRKKISSLYHDMTPEIDYSTKNIPSCGASIREGNLRNLIAQTEISAIRGINDDVQILEVFTYRY